MNWLVPISSLLGGLAGAFIGAMTQWRLHRREKLWQLRTRAVEKYSVVYITAELMHEFVGPHAWHSGFPQEWNTQLAKAYHALWRVRAEAPNEQLRKSAQDVEHLFDEMRKRFYGWKLRVTSINANPVGAGTAQVRNELGEIEEQIDQLWDRLQKAIEKYLDMIIREHP